MKKSANESGISNDNYLCLFCLFCYFMFVYGIDSKQARKVSDTEGQQMINIHYAIIVSEINLSY